MTEIHENFESKNPIVNHTNSITGGESITYTCNTKLSESSEDDEDYDPNLENPPNAYIKTYLLPDRSRKNKRKTKIRRNTKNPIYHETVKYKISQTELETRILEVSCWQQDSFGKNYCIGVSLLPLDSRSWDGTNIKRWLSLEKKVRASKVKRPLAIQPYRGEIVLSVKYVPANLVIMNALNQYLEIVNSKRRHTMPYLNEIDENMEPCEFNPATQSENRIPDIVTTGWMVKGGPPGLCGFG